MKKLTTLYFVLFLGLTAFVSCTSCPNKKCEDPNAVCGNGIAEVGELCDGGDLRGFTCENLNVGFSGGNLACSNICSFNTTGCVIACSDNCESGAQECSADGKKRRVCNTQSNGCLDWSQTDCPSHSPNCQMISGTATCTSSGCTNQCTLGQKQCSDYYDAILTCIMGTNGCTRWESESCEDGTMCEDDWGEDPYCAHYCPWDCWEPGYFCDGDNLMLCKEDDDGCMTSSLAEDCSLDNKVCLYNSSLEALCAEPKDGNSCDTAIAITLPYSKSGIHFAGDYSDTINLLMCSWWGSEGPDVVFSVDLEAGDRVAMQADSEADATWAVIRPCSQTPGECLAYSNETWTGTELLVFTAPETATYHLVLEFNFWSVYLIDYSVLIFMPDDTETECDDGMDNDLNGLTDCLDPACYGVGTCPQLFWKEEFETWPPAGWTVENGGATQYTWFSSANDTNFREFPLASGLFAMVDADATGTDTVFDDSLITPELDLSTFSHVELHFAHVYRDNGEYDSASVDVSTNNGVTWTNALHLDDYIHDTPYQGEHRIVDISSMAAGHFSVRIRFRYQTTGYDWYWLLDNVRVLGR